jgi:hypothetical protein
MKFRKRTAVMAVIVGIAILAAVVFVLRTPSLHTEDAVKIAVDAYIYGYPLVTFDMARRQQTNVAVPDGEHAPMGQMYDPQGYYVPNAINRYNLAMWMPLKYNADGSLDMYIQPVSPGADKEANWLPAPTSGLFNLTVRIYWPTQGVLGGTYKLAPTKKVQ